VERHDKLRHVGLDRRKLRPVNPLATPGAPGVTAMNAWGGPANYNVWSPSVGLFNWPADALRWARATCVGRLRAAVHVYVRPDGLDRHGAAEPAFAVTPADGLLKPEAMTSR